MTAYPTEETIKASFSMRAVDYLTKPLRQEGLLYCVNKALQQMDLGDNRGLREAGEDS
jgi:DNA-binding NtrC family response regulator